MQKQISKKIIRKLIETVTEYQMFQNNDSILVGVSGGPDSVALIHILTQISNPFSLKLAVAHLNHSLRGTESENEARFVAALAKTQGLPFYVKTVNIFQLQKRSGGSLETLGRQERYRFFLEIAEREKYDQIALGHQSDDNAELVLMNLLRGSGLKGMSGIPAVRKAGEGRCRIIRPLIHCTKSEIITFLDQEKLTYKKDKSNTNPLFIRNRIRCQLLPMLRKMYNPKIDSALNRFASITRIDNEWMNSVVAPLFNKAVLEADSNRVVLELTILLKAHPAIQRRILREGIRRVKGDLRRIRFDHIQSVLGALNQKGFNGSFDLPGRIRIRCASSHLIFTCEKAALRTLKTSGDLRSKVMFEYRIDGPCSMVVKEIRMKLKFSKIDVAKIFPISGSESQRGLFDMDKLVFPLILRNSKPGDRFRPLGMSGTQKVNRFFINQKISRKDRTKCPVMTSRGKVVWVVGHRIDESAKIDSKTRMVFKAELFLA